MATDINEVYKMFPCAKAQAEENIEFWGSDESLSESNMPQHLEVAVKIHGGEEDLYNFFQQIIHHDHFLIYALRVSTILTHLVESIELSESLILSKYLSASSQF